MLYLKTCNNLVYIDFTKKDFNDFIYKYGKENVNKITLIINELEPTCLYWLSKIVDMEQYKKTKVIIATATYTKLYLDFIRRVLKEFPKLNSLVKIQGGSYVLANERMYYTFYKKGYYTNINISGNHFGGYTEGNIDEYVYCDMFYNNGAAIYGPSCMYKGTRNTKWDYMLRLAYTLTDGRLDHPVTKEQSCTLYDKYVEHRLRTFNEIEGQKGILPDGTIVDLARIFVSPPMPNTIGEIDSVQIIRGASNSCEAMYMDN